MTTEVIGYSAALLGAIHMLPQFIKSIRTKNVKDVSLYMIILYLLANGLWAIYGYRINSIPVLLADGFAFVVTFAQLIAKLKYEKNG